MRDKKWCYIMISYKAKKEVLTFVNIYVPITGAPKNIKQMLAHLKRKIDRNIVKIVELCPCLSCSSPPKHPTDINE